MAGNREPERRRAPRIKIGARVESLVYDLVPARLVDLSATGALLEHAEPVRPGGFCELVLRDERREFRLQCRIVRSVVTRPPQGPDPRKISYHTGVEFFDLTPAQREALEALLSRYGGSGWLKPTGGLDVFLLV